MHIIKKPGFGTFARNKRIENLMAGDILDIKGMPQLLLI